MTPNQRIVEAAYDVLRGEVPGEPTEAGMCLALVRVVIERAFYDGRWEFYERHRTVKVNELERASQDPYARDLEASLRGQGMAVPALPRTGPPADPRRYVNLATALSLGLLEPGDLLFRWDTARDANDIYVGHVAILLPGRLVLENVAHRAGALQRGPTTLSKLEAWQVTSVMRFRPREGGAAQPT